MILRVTAPSRLHWGLVRPVPKPDGRRAFGGMGLTLEAPGVHLLAFPSDESSWSGPNAERLRQFAQRYAEGIGGFSQMGVPSIRWVVERCPPAHCGLGSGTQLALATAWVLARLSGHPEDVGNLAALTGRALRSSLGCQGFEKGGLLLDPGHPAVGQSPKVEPPECREEYPSNWPILVLLAEEPGAWHGSREKKAFVGLESADNVSDSMEALARQEILPAVRARDFGTMGRAVHQFNRLAGQAFAGVQGGLYSSPGISRIIQKLLLMGVEGCGQSSWGPAVFGLMRDMDHANWVLNRIQDECPHGVWVTRAQNHGASLEVDSGANKAD